MGADMLAHGVALTATPRRKWFAVRKKAKERGTNKIIEGADVSGLRVLLVDDVVTGGGSISQAYDAIEESGGIVVAAVTLMDRADAMLAADVLVVPEVHETNHLRNELGVSSHWQGRYPAKGLGVFAFNGWTVELAADAEELPWAAPLLVRDPLGTPFCTLVAIWTRAPGQANGRPSYAAQVTAVIDRWETDLANGEVCLAGDFNTSGQSARPAAHLANTSRLEDLGVRSAYHAFTGEDHGNETQMTLRWGAERRWFHCDFLFLPQRMTDRLEHVAVGDPAAWIETGLSDHAPVSADIAPPVEEAA